MTAISMYCLVCGGHVQPEERLRLERCSPILAERLALHARCGSLLSSALAASLDSWMLDHLTATLPTYELVGVSLSPRSRQVLQGICHGKKNREIASDLCLSPLTIKNYVSNLFAEVGVRCRAELISLALTQGWVPPS